jgi:hypothetical protein
MGLRNTLSRAITSAFGIIGDLTTVVTYHTKSTTYNPTTGTYSGSDGSIIIPKAAIVAFDLKEIDNDVVKYNDCKVIFPGDVLGLVPVLTDTLDFNGQSWNLMRNLSAPDGLLNILHVREK